MLHAKLLAIWVSVELAVFQGSLDILLESDSLMAIDEVKKRLQFFLSLGGIVFDIVSLSLVFSSCNFLYTSREANSLVHNLVKWVKENEMYSF